MYSERKCVKVLYICICIYMYVFVLVFTHQSSSRITCSSFHAHQVSHQRVLDLLAFQILSMGSEPPLFILSIISTKNCNILPILLLHLNPHPIHGPTFNFSKTLKTLSSIWTLKPLHPFHCTYEYPPASYRLTNATSYIHNLIQIYTCQVHPFQIPGA